MVNTSVIKVGDVIYFKFYGGVTVRGFVMNIKPNVTEKEEKYFLSFSDGDSVSYSEERMKTILVEYAYSVERPLLGLELI